MSESKIWFITGAARGLGRVWTEAALNRGDRVIATARKPDALADLADTHGPHILPLPLDVTDREAVFDIIAQGHRHFGRLDVILSNAGYGYMGAVEELDPEAAKANFETNVWGTLSVIQAALPILRAQGGGHIITLSSVAGILSGPTGGAYVASKFAIEALSEALAAEVAPFGIKVTMLEPGSYATDFDTGTRMAPSIPVYDSIRKAIRVSADPASAGDPAATASIVLELVDLPQPPLRLVLGSRTIPMIHSVYGKRLAEWDRWAETSNAAQTL